SDNPDHPDQPPTQFPNDYLFSPAVAAPPVGAQPVVPQTGSPEGSMDGLGQSSQDSGQLTQQVESDTFSIFPPANRSAGEPSEQIESDTIMPAVTVNSPDSGLQQQAESDTITPSYPAG